MRRLARHAKKARTSVYPLVLACLVNATVGCSPETGNRHQLRTTIDTLGDTVVVTNHEGARRVRAHKTSMLQDVESGRALETEALIGVYSTSLSNY